MKSIMTIRADKIRYSQIQAIGLAEPDMTVILIHLVGGIELRYDYQTPAQAKRTVVRLQRQWEKWIDA